jgi:hypothetical protein
MPDFEELQTRAREDIQVALSVWTEILGSPERGAKFAYAKGSATKEWDSPIDYVPVVSDLDIHVEYPEGKSFVHSPDEFADAMEVSTEYERRFYERHRDSLHLPRSQVIPLEQLKKAIIYIPPRRSDVRVLFGELGSLDIPDIDTIRHVDLENLQELGTFLQDMPLKVVDRTGLDFWTTIRFMAWRVSPSPVRLLTQVYDDPIDLWSWNRSQTEGLLREYNYDKLADLYHDFYMAAWEAFLTDFKSSYSLRECTKHGYYLLKGCFQESQSFID